MLRIKTVLLKKDAASGNPHWRQVSLFIESSTEQYYIKTFYGRTMHNLKKQKEFPFVERAFALHNFAKMQSDLENEHYEVIELIHEEIIAPAIDQLVPQNLNMLSSPEDIEQCLSEPTNQAISVVTGERVYIKIGFESVASVGAKNSYNQIVEIASPIAKDLCKMIKLGEYEQMVLEGYLSKGSLLLTDCLAINGIELKQSFLERIGMVDAMAKDVQHIRVAQPIPVDKKMAKPHLSLEQSEAHRYFMIKPGNKETLTPNSSGWILPSFYSLVVEVGHPYNFNKVAKRKDMENFYHFGLLTDESSFSELGIIELPEHQPVGTQIKVNFFTFIDSSFLGIWLPPDYTRVKQGHEATSAQLENVPALWQCHITSNEASKAVQTTSEPHQGLNQQKETAKPHANDSKSPLIGATGFDW